MSLCFCFQVIRNLVSNAIKFSPQGGEVIINVYFEPKPLMKGKRHSVSSVVKKEGKAAKSAAVSAAGSSVRGLSRIFSDHILSQFSPDGGSVATPPHPNSPPSIFGRLVVSVTDNGPGISAENQKRLFKEVIQVSHPPNTPPSATSYTLSSQPLFHPPLSLFSTSLSPSPISIFNLSFTLPYTLSPISLFYHYLFSSIRRNFRLVVGVDLGCSYPNRSWICTKAPSGCTGESPPPCFSTPSSFPLLIHAVNTFQCGGSQGDPPWSQPYILTLLIHPIHIPILQCWGRQGHTLYVGVTNDSY